jgi:hypothetical protein
MAEHIQTGGAQSVDGVKTFTASPIVPTPTTTSQAAPKGYVDSAVAGGGSVTSVNTKTGVVVINQDEILDGTTYKQYSQTEKTKLAGVATGATANSTDATLLNRTNHTGSQAESTITNLISDLAAKEPAITAGITAQYYRGDKTFQTLNQDAVPDGTTNKAYTATEKTKLSGIATNATANSSDATLLARANHTGTQLASTVSDFSSAADARITAATSTGTGSLVRATSPAITTPTGIVKDDVGLGSVDNTSNATERAATATLTNKILNSTTNTFASVVSEASSATPTPTGDSRENELYETALAANATIAAPTGTATNGNKLIIRIKDNGTARTLAWNAIYRGIGVTLPATTVISKTLYLGARYNSTDTKWDVIAYGAEA